MEQKSRSHANVYWKGSEPNLQGRILPQGWSCDMEETTLKKNVFLLLMIVLPFQVYDGVFVN